MLANELEREIFCRSRSLARHAREIESMPFQPGDVLRVTWDGRPIRVLMGDAIETFYETFISEIGWNLIGARTATYYRMATSALRSSAELVRNDPLTKREIERHRPDLPMRLFRTGNLDWSKSVESWPAMDRDIEVPAAKLAIIPFGPKGAGQKAVAVAAENGKFFKGSELLAAARRSQKAICAEVAGVGLYRSGMVGGVPSYYLWGAVDKAGHAR